MASNNSHTFLDPLWRRLLLIGAVVAWFLVELTNGDKFWTTMVGVVAVYGAYAYLYAYVPSGSKDPSDKS